jgi:uracil-DNA glycosylase
MISYQHLDQLKELYILKATGTSFVDPVSINPSPVDETKSLPQNLDALHKLISGCYLCDLSKSRREVLVSHGQANSGLMIIGDFPSLAEDNDGMFAGKSGQMLKDMIEKVLMLSVEDVYFTHAVKCMPASGKKPLQNESKSCQPFYLKQIELIKPKLIMTLGSFSYNLLTNEQGDFQKDKGVIMPFYECQLIAIEHPHVLITNPDSKKATMKELLQIKSYLCEN